MSLKKKHIGLLGLGSHSTCYYLEQLNAEYNRLYGGFSTCPIKMLNTNFNEINPYLPHDFENLEPITSKSIIEISELGIECLIVPNITLHETLDRLKLGKIMIVHPVYEAARKLKVNGAKEIVLFGSIFTMDGVYIPQIFLEYSIKTIQPSDNDKSAIDDLRKIVYQHGASKESEAALKSLIERYINDFEVVIACTELSMLLENQTADKLYDLVQIQIDKAVAIINT